MLCCLVGALLAGNVALVWRLLRSAARSERAGLLVRGAIIGALLIAPLGVGAAALAKSGGPDAAQAGQGVFDVLCLGRR